MFYLDLLIHFQHFEHCLNDISEILGFLKYLWKHFGIPTASYKINSKYLIGFQIELST